MHLIDGQPLHLLDSMPSIPKPPPRKNKHAHSSASISSVQNSTSHTKLDNGTALTGKPWPGPTTSSSKRGSSPPTEEPSLKKTKLLPQVTSSCVVCGHSPHHLVKDCPTILEGSKRYSSSNMFEAKPTNFLISIAREIKRLQDDPTHSSTVNILGKLLKKQKRRELAQSSPDVLMHSD